MHLNSGCHTAVTAAAVPFPDAVEIIAFPAAFPVVMLISKSIARHLYVFLSM